MNKELKRAIEQKKIIEFYYHGGVRVVEPFAYGIHKETGAEVLSAYQIGGHSRSQKLLRWRLYIVKKMKGVRILDEQFSASNRPYYKVHDSRMSLVYVAV